MLSLNLSSQHLLLCSQIVHTFFVCFRVAVFCFSPFHQFCKVSNKSFPFLFCWKQSTLHWPSFLQNSFQSQYGFDKKKNKNQTNILLTQSLKVSEWVLFIYHRVDVLYWPFMFQQKWKRFWSLEHLLHRLRCVMKNLLTVLKTGLWVARMTFLLWALSRIDWVETNWF